MLQEYVLIAAINGNWKEQVKFTVEKEKAIETCFQKAKEYNLNVFRCIRTNNERPGSAR